jgi:type IV pilus assembly protein PilM
MMSFVRNWLGPKTNPIGVDFGSDSLKLAQVANVKGEWRLIAAASADVPSHVRHDAAARMEFLANTTRELLVQGGFSGRTAMLALPAASMFIQHLRLPKMDEEAIRRTLPWEARGKLPIDPSRALLRHHIAGEVYVEQEPKNEVILMAAGRELVDQFLATASRARLDVVGMNVEPKAIIDCFGHVYRRKTDLEMTTCFVDLGSGGSRAIVARAGHMLFARCIPIGGEHLTQAVARAMDMKYEDAKLLRMRLCSAQGAAQPANEPAPAPPPPGEGLAILNASLAASSAARTYQDAGGGPATALASSPAAAPTQDELSAQMAQVQQACREPLNKLVEELNLCRRYFEATFGGQAVERLVFVGGEAKHRWLCQHIAREMGLAAQVGDPLARMGRVSDVGMESGIDRRQPQPNWSVAIGLSLGPAPAYETSH